MDNKGSNFRTDADGLYPTPGVGNISPNDNPDLAGSINSQTIPTSTGDQYNHDLGNRVNELFSNPENPSAQDGKTQNREEPEIGKEEIFFDIQASEPINPSSPSPDASKPELSEKYSRTSARDFGIDITREFKGDNNPANFLDNVIMAREYYGQMGEE